MLVPLRAGRVILITIWNNKSNAINNEAFIKLNHSAENGEVEDLL